jgi:hypothetical protein
VARDGSVLLSSGSYDIVRLSFGARTLGGASFDGTDGVAGVEVNGGDRVRHSELLSTSPCLAVSPVVRLVLLFRIEDASSSTS